MRNGCGQHSANSISAYPFVAAAAAAVAGTTTAGAAKDYTTPLLPKPYSLCRRAVDAC